MAKKLLLILLCLFIFVGCSNNESKDPKNDPNNKENVDPIDEHNDNNPEIIDDDGKWHWIALKYDENDEYCKEHFKGEYKKNHLYAINDKTDENVELYNSEIDYFYYGTLEEDRRIVFVSNNVLYSVNFDGTGLIDLYHSNKMTEDVLGIKGKYTYFVDDNIICRVDLTNKNLEQIKKQENICQINPFNDNFVEFQVLNKENELEYHILALNTKEEEIYYSVDEMNETVSRISKVFDWLYSCINNRKYVGTIIIFPEIAVNEYLMTIYNYLDENEGKLHNNELEVIQKLLDVYHDSIFMDDSKTRSSIYCLDIFVLLKYKGEKYHEEMDLCNNMYRGNNLRHLEFVIEEMDKHGFNFVEYETKFVGNLDFVDENLNYYIKIVNDILKKHGIDDIITHYFDLVLSKNVEIYLGKYITQINNRVTDYNYDLICKIGQDYGDIWCELRIKDGILYLCRDRFLFYSLCPILLMSDNLVETIGYSNGIYYFVDGSTVYSIARSLWDNKEWRYKQFEINQVFQQENINTIEVVNDNIICLLNDNNVVKYNMQTQQKDTTTFTDWNSITEWAK